ncbi:MAG TPA: tetratricopeptide repeat protein [Cyclobacteriaceae bacterium]|jgi:tetratricopeptide (TPR) repeat protein|nr:tetratricopeptide repeat protein [Cytophagales bacterium]HRE68854.1 tetratricopeptide repeat protein [Cyclobacteriaceae bacterium]HRF32657.1 tetratricopeptide repeat protein [Cyclobacteriaceae bacterium]
MALLRLTLLFVVWVIHTGHAQERRTAQYFFDKAESAHTARSYKTALAHLNECLRLDPYFMEAYFNRAQVREALGDKQGALTDYNIYLERNPENKEALFSRAVSRFEYGQWAMAKEDFQKLLKLAISGETNTIFFQTQKGDDGVSRAFSAGNNLRPIFFDYLGQIELKLKNYTQAKICFDSAIRLAPEQINFYIGRGLALQQIGDTTQARLDFNKVLQLDAENSLARHNLALLGRNQSFAETEKLLTEAIEANPKLPYSYVERGLLRLNSGNTQGALSDYNEAIKLEPDNYEYLLNRGLVKERIKDYDGALTDYKKVIELKPEYEKGWLSHGNVMVNLNRVTEAIEDYTTAITYYPDYGLAYYNRAQAWHRLGKTTEACNDLRKAKALGFLIAPKVEATICK